ncbi:uncharacterized protein LOC108457918 [Gossypium arboreum]|uniref:Mucin-19 n=1 Tax=Gossypium arboreum TaxID=29729 RepID=A0ABR0Q9M2_GOSAR|nr:uncharacterized protein LOC108457918 [Gossypium arboreum]XP_017612618.2 uncharacterized protein LOC108457918 [Gossypium arboreum]KAK5835977.1 hypothetical protein PVK06_011709 [Gossypium arboreum]
MKASLKFREEKRPVLRAKIPLSIFGLPFQSGLLAGETKELTLNLSTFFESGPSIKVAYRPNDTWNPFSLIVKIGTGPFGSPISSSMLMSAEFNLLGHGNPSFMLHFKPQFGDFSIKKSQSSLFDKAVKPRNGVVLEDASSIEVMDMPAVNGDSIRFFAEKRKLADLSSRDIAGILSGIEVAARTTVPVKGKALVNFRWGMRIPSEMKSGVGGIVDPKTGVSLTKIPFLVMDKIGIEHVDGADSKQAISTASKSGLGEAPNSDVVEACYILKRQLEALQSENGLLKRAVEDLRREISGGKFGDLNSGKYREMEWDGFSKSKKERRNNENKSMEGDLNEELKNALKGAAGA